MSFPSNIYNGVVGVENRREENTHRNRNKVKPLYRDALKLFVVHENIFWNHFEFNSWVNEIQNLFKKK